MSDNSSNPNLESHLEKCRDFLPIKISKLEDENELLREQLENLKQELRWQRKLTKAYLQFLKDAEDDLRQTNHELSTTLMLNKLRLNEAKKFANSLGDDNNRIIAKSKEVKVGSKKPKTGSKKLSPKLWR